MRLATRLWIVSTIFLPTLTYADLANILGRYVGYTIVGTKTIAGYVEKGKKKDDFEGCDFNRTIVFDDGTGLVCSSYGYQYAYRPTAVILMKSMQISGTNYGQIVMIVESEKYDMQGVVLQ
jgi:hypothetical protein